MAYIFHAKTLERKLISSRLWVQGSRLKGYNTRLILVGTGFDELSRVVTDLTVRTEAASI